jgi:hypothetical protein
MMSSENNPVSDSQSKVSIGSGHCMLEFKDIEHSGNYQCRLNLGLKASIEFIFEANTSIGMNGFSLCDPLATYIDGIKQELLTIKHVNFFQAATLIPVKTPLQYIGDDDTKMRVIKARLFNFVDFWGGNGPSAYDLVLVWQNLKIVISATKNRKQAFDRLKAGAVYEETHLVEITYEDNSEILGIDATRIIQTLNRFLTFVKGSWCQLVLPEGFNDNERVWFQLNAPREAYRNPSSWFPIHSAKEVQTLFESFYSSHSKPELIELWRTLIYWYQNANNNERGLDVGIIIAQTAMERLSYFVIVQQSGMLSEKGFKDLRASDKFRLLLSHYKINLNVPESLKTITTNMIKCRWTDGPHTVTDIRNSLVHPKVQNRDAIHDSMYDAWRLTMWYLEVCFLKFFDYKGSYTNRLTAQWLGETDEL